MHPRLQSRPVRWAAVATLAVGAYALAGFELAPRIVRSQAISYVKKTYGRDLAVGEVRVNPFLLQIEIRDLSLPDADGRPMVYFKRLFVDFELSSIWHRAYVFRDVTLEAPGIHAVVRADHRLNLLDLAPKTPPEPEPSPPPRLWLQSFAVEGGEIGYADLSRRKPFERRFSPVTFSLTDFRTTAEGGGYALSARTPNAENFELKGALEVTPQVASRGEFSFRGLHLPGVAEYLGDALPFGLTSGTAELAGSYDVELGADLAARLKIPRIAVADLGLRARGADDAWVRIPSIEVTDTALALVKRTASVGSVTIQGLDVKAWMDAGGINLMRLAGSAPVADVSTAPGAPPEPAAAAPATAATPAAPPAQPARPATPWTATVGTFALEGAHIDFEDRRAEPARRFQVAPLDITVKGASLDLARPVDLTVSAVVNDVAPFRAEGTVTPSPMAADLAIKLDGARMTILQPYVLPVADLTITEGRLTVDGRVKLDPPDAPGPELGFTGDVSIDDFASKDNALQQDFVNFASLRVQGIKYAKGPDSASIERVLVGKPFARVVISPERVINVSAVLDPKGTAAALEARRAAARAEAALTPAERKRREAEREEAEEQASEQRKKQGAAAKAVAPLPAEGMPVRIGEVKVSDGTLDFADHNVQPNFAAKIVALNGSITGLSSSPAAHAKVDLKGKVGEFSPVTIAGEIQPFSFERYTDIGLRFENISLPIFNPYSGRFAGYSIAKGKLTTDLHYRIENRALDAQHHIRIDQLEWGEETAGKGEASLPVKFATVLLRDRNGVIDLDIPVQGTIDDPTFRIGPIVWKVIKNLIVKAVTAPFALLGALFSGAEEAQHVDFAPGSAALDPTAAGQLGALGKSLVEKPGLTLEVPVMSLAALDGPALAEQAWQSALAGAAADAPPPPRKEGAVRPPYPELSPQNKLKVLSALIEKQTGAEPKAPEPPAAPDGASKEEKQALADAATIEAWEREARGRVTVPADAADRLAEARATAVERALLEGTGLEPTRVFLAKNGTVTDDAGKVQLKLELK
ncbi:MAG: DUF748 domain-containing protein [Steroidobacteraceae bacterium]